MSWFKVDDRFHASWKLNSIPKRYRLQAAGLWAVAGSWVAGERTDGFVPNYMIEAWGPTSKTLDSLVDSGLWRRELDGFTFNSWLEYNPSKEHVEAERAASADRMRKSRERRREERAGQECASKDVALQHPEMLQRNTQGVLQRPDPTRPDPLKDMRIASDSQFSDWWAHYPLKKSKGQAEKAYRTARKIVDQETLIAATISYAKLMADKDRQYIAYPATWLNGKKWEDEDIAPADPDSVRTWLGECWKQADTRSVEERSGLTFRQPNESPADDEDITTFNRRVRQQWIADNHDDIIRRILAREDNAA